VVSGCDAGSLYAACFDAAAAPPRGVTSTARVGEQAAGAAIKALAAAPVAGLPGAPPRQPAPATTSFPRALAHVQSPCVQHLLLPNSSRRVVMCGAKPQCTPTHCAVANCRQLRPVEVAPAERLLHYEPSSFTGSNVAAARGSSPQCPAAGAHLVISAGAKEVLGAWLLRPKAASCTNGTALGGGGGCSDAAGWDAVWLATRPPPVGGARRKSTPQVRLTLVPHCAVAPPCQRQQLQWGHPVMC
jgi:hypothetical protein